MKKPLAALLLSAAAVAALAVPAGASPAPATWTRQTLPCATGHKSATLVQKWQDQFSAVKTWVDNPCRGQWFYLAWNVSSDRMNVVDVAPRHHGQIGGSVTPDDIELGARKTCSFGDVVVSHVGAKDC